MQILKYFLSPKYGLDQTVLLHRTELFLRFFIAKSKNFTQIAGQDVGIAAAYHILPFSLINEMGKDYLKKLNITLWGALATVYNHCFTPKI